MSAWLRTLAAGWLVLLQRSASTEQCEVQEDTDYEGTEFWWELGLTRDECCALCWKEPNCTVAVFFGAGCYLKNVSAAASSRSEHRCSMRPGRAPVASGAQRLRELAQPAPDELNFCAEGLCRRDTVRGGVLALAPTSMRPQECVELATIGSGDERTEPTTPWKPSMANAVLRQADLLDSGYHLGKCEDMCSKGVVAGGCGFSPILEASAALEWAGNASGSCAVFGCGSFDPSRGCQCDPSCKGYDNCCSDYEHQCLEGGAELQPGSDHSDVGKTPTSAKATSARSRSTTPATFPSTATAAAVATTATTTASGVTTTSLAPTAAPATAEPEDSVTAPAPSTSRMLLSLVPVGSSSLAPSKPAPQSAKSEDDEAIQLVHTPAPTSSSSPLEAAASCHVFGCAGYHEEQVCQCNAKCTRYNNCCTDYSTTCTQASRAGDGAAPTEEVDAPAEPQAALAAKRSCKIEQDTEYPDSASEEIGTVENTDECASVCVSMPGCTHFSIDASEYYRICMVMKSKPGQSRKKAGSVSGLCGPAAPRAAEEDAERKSAAGEAPGSEPSPEEDERQRAPPPAPTHLVSIDIFRAMKAAAADEQETMDDDMADILGDLKYVHTELLTEHLLDPVRKSRKYDIDCIRRQRYTFRNPAALVDSRASPLPDFGPFVTYDFGVATNPDQLPTLQRYGDFIGIQEGCSGGHCDVRFPAETPYFWFSVGNFCPNLPWGQKGRVDDPNEPNEECVQYEEGGGFLTGGLCEGGWSKEEVVPTTEPSGERGCVYAYGASQVVSLDILTGITNESCSGGRKCESWGDFRENCTTAEYKRQFSGSGDIKDVEYCVEYDMHPLCEANCDSDECVGLRQSGRTVELGLPFWRGRCDSRANSRRVEKLADAFGIQGASTQHRLLDQGVLDMKTPCLREGSDRCRPGMDAGGPYCSRTFSGVCQSCFIPGALHGVEPPVKPFCPLDILRGVDYNDSEKYPVPKCKSDKPSDGCCLYSDTCAGESDPALAELSDDGYAVVAARQSTSDMMAFLKRAALEINESAVWEAACDDALWEAAYHQWAPFPTGRTLGQALAEAEEMLESWTARGDASRQDVPVVFKRFLTRPPEVETAGLGPQLQGLLLASLCALAAASAAWAAGRMTRRGGTPHYMKVGPEGTTTPMAARGRSSHNALLLLPAGPEM